MERRLRLGGVSTAVLEGGDGSSIVLLHGPGAYGAKWLRVIPDLMTNHRVIAPDLPGHGASEGIDGPFDVERVLEWLDDLIECTCSTAPVLVGQILGGAIAARFASTRGERLKELVLVDALGLAPFQPTPEFGQDSASDTRAAWDEIAPGYDRTHTPTQMGIAREGLRSVAMHSGMSFLN